MYPHKDLRHKTKQLDRWEYVYSVTGLITSNYHPGLESVKFRKSKQQEKILTTSMV